MRYPIVPINTELDDIKIKDISIGIVNLYVNQVLEHYGPPCDFCIHFDVICDKKIRNFNYILRCGPFTNWTIRKFCKEFEGKEESNNENIKRQMFDRLDCFVQQYCR